MKRRARVVGVALLLLIAAHQMGRADERLGHFDMGISYLGAQFGWRISQPWGAELRYLQDSSDTTDGKLTAHVISLRGYRFGQMIGRAEPLIGIEAGATSTDGNSEVLKTSGYLIGAFVGARYHLGRRFSIGLDAGPYFVSAQTKENHVSRNNLDFVLNSCITLAL